MTDYNLREHRISVNFPFSLAFLIYWCYFLDHGFEILENCASNVNLNSALIPSKASVNVRELDWKASWPPQQSSYPSRHR